MPLAPLQVVTWTATQSFQLGGHNTLIIHWTLISVYTNSLLDINIPVKHTSCAAPKFSHPLKGLTFWPLNWVTGHPCHGLPSCQLSASCGLLLLTQGQTWDRQTDRRQTMANNALCPHPVGRDIITKEKMEQRKDTRRKEMTRGKDIFNAVYSPLDDWDVLECKVELLCSTIAMLVVWNNWHGW